MSAPRWLAKARGYVGQREISGRKHNPLILQWWTSIRAGFSDDETPWCAAFVGGVLESAGIKSSRSAAARSYEKWGVALDEPAIGCIVVFSRKGGGHVGFCVGQTATTIDVLGGNQGDAVNVRRFAKKGASLRVTAYRWPAGEPLPHEAADDVGGDDVQTGGPVTLFGGGDAEPQGFTAKVKHYANAVIAGGSTLLASVFDWRVASVLAVLGFLVFCIIWFTHWRKALRRTAR